MTVRWHRLLGLASLCYIASCDAVPTEPTYQRGLVLTPTQPLLASDDSLQLVVHRLGSAKPGTVVFTSSDTALLHVSPTGVLLAGGNTTAEPRKATVEAREGKLSAKVAVTILPSPVARVEVGLDSVVIISGDSSAPLPLVLRDARGRLLEKRPVLVKARTSRSAIRTEIVEGTDEELKIRTHFRPQPDTSRTVVFVNANGVTDSLTVIIIPRSVARIAIDSTQVVAEDSTTLRWRAYDAFGHLLTDRSAAVTSLDSGVILASPSGVVTAQTFADTTVRTARLSITVERITVTHNVRVLPAMVSTIALRTTEERPEPGDTIPWSVVVQSAGGTELLNRTVSLSSADSSIVHVMAGSQSAIATTYPDTATRTTALMACYAALCDTATVTVAPSRVARIALNTSALTLPVRSSETPDVTVFGRREQELVNREIAWSSTDATVASVSPSGTILGTNFGHTRIVARAEGVEAEINLAVEALQEPTGLPTIWIAADGAIVDTETWINARVTSGERAAEAVRLEAQIRGRGNSTWGMPKKPYRIRLRSEGSMLGLQPARNWVLLANFADKTLMRNALSYSFAKRIGVPFAHDQRHVDVFLNGEYLGNYLLTEHNEVHPSRVAIATASSAAIRSGTAVGGYYLETDWREQEPPLFRSAERGVPLTIKAPSGVPDAELIEYIRQDFAGFERAICSDEIDSPLDRLGEFMDVESFVTSFWVHELFKNAEMWSGSTYLFRPLNGRMSMGPVWDFDIAGGNINYDPDAASPDGWYVRGSGLFPCLFASGVFRERVNARWREMRGEQIPAILAELDSLEVQLGRSAYLNFERWSILNVWVWPNVGVYGSYAAEVEALRSWLRARIAFIDREIGTL